MIILKKKTEKGKKKKPSSKEEKSKKKEVVQAEWSKREKQDLYRYLVSFGVPSLDDSSKDWNTIKEGAGLKKKSVEMIESYFVSFLHLCKQIMHVDKFKQASDPSNSNSSVQSFTAEEIQLTSDQATSEGLTYAKCKKVISRIMLMDNIRSKLLKNNKLEKKLKEANRAGLPTWWKPELHDVQLLSGTHLHFYFLTTGITKHGFGNWDDICKDDEFSFYEEYKRISERKNLFKPLETTPTTAEKDEKQKEEKPKDEKIGETEETDSKSSEKAKKKKEKSVADVLMFPREVLFTFYYLLTYIRRKSFPESNIYKNLVNYCFHVFVDNLVAGGSPEKKISHASSSLGEGNTKKILPIPFNSKPTLPILNSIPAQSIQITQVESKPTNSVAPVEEDRETKKRKFEENEINSQLSEFPLEKNGNSVDSANLETQSTSKKEIQPANQSKLGTLDSFFKKVPKTKDSGS